MDYTDALKFCLVFLFLLNCFVSVKVFMNGGLTPTQKILQTMLIWVLPLVGGVAVFLFYSIDGDAKGPNYHRDADDGHDGFSGGIQ